MSSQWPPSIVPDAEADQDVYLVMDDFGDYLGRAWCEASEQDTGRAALMRHLLEGRFKHPARIVAFNTAEGWSRDVTADIADELRRRLVEFDDVEPSVIEFVERAVRR